MIFDGDCNFCKFWVARWQLTTRESVDYLPFQDPAVAARFPELPRERFESAVHLIEPDGAVYSGAEAAFRALATNPRAHWLPDWYARSPAFARATERAYRFVAEHRELFSTLTRLAWGKHFQPPSHVLVRSVFLRSLAVIYLIAFVSLWVQIHGLIGSRGILPAIQTMDSAQKALTAGNVGWDRYRLLPTLCWFNASDTFLGLQCAAGTALAILLLAGIAPAPCLFLLWLIYLSLSTVCREFLGFQWDILLLETGFLAIFFAPLQWLPRRSPAARPSRVVLWLLRWLLFRLMFESGCVKWLSGDPPWRNLTALTFHYETQPLPTWIGWYAHQLPASVQKVSTALMFGIEVFLPFLIFGPRRLRQFSCIAFIAIQAFIFLTGNYCFFNLLTLALCLVLLDDAALQRFIPFNRHFDRASSPPPAREPSLARSGEETERTIVSAPGPLFTPTRCESRTTRGPTALNWPRQLTVPLACITVVISLIQLSTMFRIPMPWPKPVVAVYGWLAPFRSFNSYGLFAVMTTSRPEIIVEGSNDGVTWREYEFKYKPGDLKRHPKFVEPHQPRLDWQMWFAALGQLQDNLWFVNFCGRLLEGSPDVLRLLKVNPFPEAPPRYVRASVYDYHFTDISTQRRTGAWWRRERKDNYLPVMSLRPTQ
jgi:predicted DCC family thiol-disulfide oxidoreductase YuxK